MKNFGFMCQNATYETEILGYEVTQNFTWKIKCLMIGVWLRTSTWPFYKLHQYFLSLIMCREHLDFMILLGSMRCLKNDRWNSLCYILRQVNLVRRYLLQWIIPNYFLQKQKNHEKYSRPNTKCSPCKKTTYRPKINRTHPSWKISTHQRSLQPKLQSISRMGSRASAAILTYISSL